MGKVPKEWWRMVRYETQTEHAGIHGNPKKGTESEILTTHT